MIKAILILSIVCLTVGHAQAALRDPTRPPTHEEATDQSPQTELKVTSILISKRRQIALIDGRWVKKGDKIRDNKVIDIRANAVKLQGPSGTITLPLIANSIKQSVP